MTPIANDGAGYGTEAERKLTADDRERADVLLEVLIGTARGPSRARTVAQLAVTVGVSERKIRTLVTYLRRQGTPILATPDRGYFFPQSREDADHTIAFLTARLRTTYETRAGIQRGLDAEFGEDTEQLELAA